MYSTFYPNCYPCFRDVPPVAPGAGSPGSMGNVGGTSSGSMQSPTAPGDFSSNFDLAPGSPTNLGTDYTQGYLRTQIGKRVRVTFLIGSNTIQDREGILDEVGISYIILRELDTGVRVLCDIYSIKFVNIFPRTMPGASVGTTRE